jgi:hypothetical protein
MIGRLIYDEREIGKEAFENGLIEKFNWHECLALAKYFRFVLGYGDARVRSNLIVFMKRRDKNFNEIRYGKYLNDLISKSRKDFKNTGEVSITKSELDFIRTIKNFKTQNIVLAILFVAKRKTNDGYVGLNDWMYIREIGCRNFSRLDIEKAFTYLRTNGKKVESADGKDFSGGHKILFINNDSDVVFEIKDNKTAKGLRQLYKEWCGGELSWCKGCESEFIKIGKNHNLCESCSKEKERERKREWARGYRDESSEIPIISCRRF